MASARLSDVQLVLFAPTSFQTRRKALIDLKVEYVTASMKFSLRATPATWARLVPAAKKLHAAVKAEEDRLENKYTARRQIEGLGNEAGT